MGDRVTDREIAALRAPASGRLEVPVGDGLIVRITATGAKTFGVWWRTPVALGQVLKGFYTIGSYPKTTLASARERAGEVLKIAREGRDPAAELKRREEARRAEEAQAAAVTVLSIVERHLQARRGQLRPSTLDQYERTIGVLRASPLAGRPLHEVKRGEVREALREIGREHAMGTARKVKTLVRAAARWAAAEDILPHDVLAGLAFKEAEPRERDRVLDDREILALWRACDDAPPIMGASVRLQLVLSLRHPSETTGMRWTDLHTARIDGIGDATIYAIPADRRKHGIPLSLPLPRLAMEVLDALRPSTGTKDLVLDGWTLGRELYWWRRTIKRRVTAETGAANFTRHDLRRTAASGMTRIGVPIHAVDTVLGHVIKGSGRAYMHGARLVEAAAALWKWNAHLERLLERPVDNVVSIAEGRA